jgi:hypothetical protein
MRYTAGPERGKLTAESESRRPEACRQDDRGGQLAVFGKGSKTRPVLVPRSLFDELSTLSLPDPTAPLFRSQKWPPGRCAWLGGCLIYTRGGKKHASVPLPGS